MSYIPGHEIPDSAAPTACWFLFRDGRIALEGSFEPPRWSSEELFERVALRPQEAHYLGRWDGMECFAAELPPDRPLPEGLELLSLRDVIAVRDEEFFRVSSQAIQLVTWASTHRYCGRCGASTEPAPGERAMKCPSCGLVQFPRVSPAVIVAVLKGEEILLARARRFAPGMYSVLAGFVEAGETLEECVHREIREETSIEVQGLRYFASQSWPFPHSLMVAFIARYRSGEITVDTREIVHASWFRRDSLPDLPLKASIARRMIEWYRAGSKEE